MIYFLYLLVGVIAMIYAERLRALREDADKKQSEIAEYLGTTQQYYAEYESGKHPLSVDRLRQLCEYYHVSADYILGLPEGLPYGTSKTKK